MYFFAIKSKLIFIYCCKYETLSVITMLYIMNMLRELFYKVIFVTFWVDISKYGKTLE